MPSPFFTFEEAAKVIDQPPKLPCPTATNIRSLVVDLTEKLGNVPSQQSTDFGYIGMIEIVDIYAITGADACANYGDPGPYRAGDDGTLIAVEQHDTTEICKANNLVFNSQTNVRRAINYGSNMAVPKIYYCIG